MSEENEIERKIETNFNFYKVSIIGLNELGATTAFLLISRQIVTDLILIDRNSKRLAAEFADLTSSSTFLSTVRIQSSDELSSCKDSRVVILCDDILDEKNENDDRKFDRVKEIFIEISRYASQCVFLIGLQPFEILSRLCLNANVFPSHRIIAPGTMTESAQFRFLISEKLSISPSNVTGLFIGPHGEQSSPLWSSVTIAGIHLPSENLSIENKDEWHQLCSNVKRRQMQIRKLKGTEIYSISMALSELVECILRDKREIHPVTVNLKGHYDVSEDFFISSPAVIGRQGVSHLITTDDKEFLAIVENFKRQNINDENLTHVNTKS